MENNKRRFNAVLSKEDFDKLEFISAKEHRKKTNLLRKWIEENYNQLKGIK